MAVPLPPGKRNRHSRFLQHCTKWNLVQRFALDAPNAKELLSDGDTQVRDSANITPAADDYASGPGGDATVRVDALSSASANLKAMLDSHAWRYDPSGMGGGGERGNSCRVTAQAVNSRLVHSL